jgi:hypothetical protein
MRIIRTVLALLLAGSMATIALAEDPRIPKKSVTLYVEGDRHVVPKFIETCRKLGPTHGVAFNFVSKADDKWDYHILVGAQRDLNLLTSFMFYGYVTVFKQYTWLPNFTGKTDISGVGYSGVSRAIGERFVKGMAQYLGWYIWSYSNSILTAWHEGVTYKARCVKHEFETNSGPDGDAVFNVCDAIADKLGSRLEDLGPEYIMTKTAGQLHYSEPRVQETFEIISEARD